MTSVRDTGTGNGRRRWLLGESRDDGQQGRYVWMTFIKTLLSAPHRHRANRLLCMTSDVDQSQVARRSACQKALFQGKKEFLGNSNPHETRSSHGIVIPNQVCGCIRRNELVTLHIQSLFCSTRHTTEFFLQRGPIFARPLDIMKWVVPCSAAPGTPWIPALVSRASRPSTLQAHSG
jgi:hypothetical protein